MSDLKSALLAFSVKPHKLDIQGQTFYIREMTTQEARDQDNAGNKPAYVLHKCMVDEDGNNYLSMEDAIILCKTLPTGVYFQIQEAVDSVVLTDSMRAKLKKN